MIVVRRTRLIVETLRLAQLLVQRVHLVRHVFPCDVYFIFISLKVYFRLNELLRVFYVYITNMVGVWKRIIKDVNYIIGIFLFARRFEHSAFKKQMILKWYRSYK